MVNRNYRILIIDERLLAESLAELLELFDFQAITAESGTEGLDIVWTIPVDLIICDILLPGLDGFSVLEALKQVPETSTIPFIFLTACTGSDYIYRARELGADDYVIKPFEAEDLITAINALLGIRPGSNAGFAR